LARLPIPRIRISVKVKIVVVGGATFMMACVAAWNQSNQPEHRVAMVRAPLGAPANKDLKEGVSESVALESSDTAARFLSSRVDDAPAPLSPPAQRKSQKFAFGLGAGLAVGQSDAMNRLQLAERTLQQNLAAGDLAASDLAGSVGETTTTCRRADRARRWNLCFTSEPLTDYLAEIDGLRGELALPADNGQWRYFSHLTAARPTSESRDLTGEDRLYWAQCAPALVGPVGEFLGVGGAPFYLIFLPLDMEQAILQAELKYRGLTEDEMGEIGATQIRFTPGPDGCGIEIDGQAAR
jgi:hypothetical protein